MPLMRGAIPAPRHLLAATPPFLTIRAVPPAFGMVPPKLTKLGNDQYGDCVTAEEGAAKMAYSVMLGLPETIITDQSVIDWARAHHVLNGAMLTDVMDAMRTDPIKDSTGRNLTDGPYKTVDWTNDALLSSAIFTGPVKIGVAAGHLENVFTDNNGWYLDNTRRDQNIDHAVGLWGFGSVGELYKILGVPMPSNASANARAYLLYTWGSIGVVTAPAMVAICDEAYIRLPTTPEEPVPTPVPPPTPTPTPGPIPPMPFGDGVYIDPNSRTYWFPPDWTRIPTP